MKHISELANILNQHFNWNKARITCLAQIVRWLIATKIVNLSQISTTFTGRTKNPSCYRRMQRFFQLFSFDAAIIARFVLSRFSLSHTFMMVIDRTNWKFGKIHLNLLVLSIVYEGIAIPIYWINLDKAGSSSTMDRMFMIAKVIYSIGKGRISHLLADREFIGKEWIQWLIDNGIKFVIRIKGNTLIKRSSEDKYPTNAESLFRYLKQKRRKHIKTLFHMGDIPVYLSAGRSPKEELLIVITSVFDKHALNRYRKRWEIETLFGCLKSKGFNLEDTRLSGKRLEKLFFIVVIAFCWAYLIGLERNRKKEIRTKTHGRKAQSLFRYGLDVLSRELFRGHFYLRKLFRFLDLNQPKSCHV